MSEIDDDTTREPAISERVVLAPPPTNTDALIEPARIEPRTPATEPDAGTKLYVVFFMLIVPPLGVVLLAGVLWSLWKAIISDV